jgi:hypothetical protein
LTQKHQAAQFNEWLNGKQSQQEFSDSLGISPRSFRRHIAPHWLHRPTIAVTGEVYDVVILDAIFINGLACLILRTVKHVVYWQWANKESLETWSNVFSKLPSPKVVVCDGHGGVLLAIKRIWPSSRIQRCLVHIERNLKQNLGVPQRHPAAAELMKLWLQIWQIKTCAETRQWKQDFEALKLRFYFAVYEFKTTYDSAGRIRRRYLNPNIKTAYLQIDRLLKQNQLFNYLELPGLDIPRTTNYVEGGINAQIRFKLIYHRGLPREHQQAMVDWYLFSLTEQYFLE